MITTTTQQAHNSSYQMNNSCNMLIQNFISIRLSPQFENFKCDLKEFDLKGFAGTYPDDSWAQRFLWNSDKCQAEGLAHMLKVGAIAAGGSGGCCEPPLPQQVQGRNLVGAQRVNPPEAPRFSAFWKAKLGLKYSLTMLV